MVEASTMDLDAELQRVQEDSVLEGISKLLEVSKPFQIRVTTAQQICNMNDHRDVALVFDMRSEVCFKECGLDKSVNISIESFKEDAFINWPQKVKQLEAGNPIFKTKYQLHAFKRRRRHWCFIIGAHSSKNVDKMILEMGKIANKEQQASMIAALQTDEEKRDFLSLRNAVLLFKALKKERLREMDLSICGFDKIEKHYRHHCLDANRQFIIPRPPQADNYPNEIFPGRLYLGDWHHASDAHIIETLGITHILNITDSCENYLAESHPYLNYLHLDLHDERGTNVTDSFRNIFEFIREACLPETHDAFFHPHASTDIGQSSGTGEDGGSKIADKDHRELPVSNQVLEINFKTMWTDVQTGQQQKEYVRIQKLFRQVNKDNPDFQTKCLVHCAMGMSRSATSVIMFIMRLFSMKLEDAFEFVKTQREATDPNDGFMEQLRKFEATAFHFEQEAASESNLLLSGRSHNHVTPSTGSSAVKRVQSMAEMVPNSKAEVAKSEPVVHKHVKTVNEGLSDHMTEETKTENESQKDLFNAINNAVESPMQSPMQPIKEESVNIKQAEIASVGPSEPALSARKIKLQPVEQPTPRQPTQSVSAPIQELTVQPLPPQRAGRKVFNFSPGPGCMPKEVLRTANSQMLDWRGTGLSVMEMNPNSKEFRIISESAKESLRQTLDIPENFTILFTEGGSQSQINAICLNLPCKYKTGNFLVMGARSRAAANEAAKFVTVNTVADLPSSGFTKAMEQSWHVANSADFFFYVDTETENGFEYTSFPFESVPASQPIVCDMSSSFLSKPIDWSKFGVVFAGSQNQAGATSMCITIVRNDLLGKQTAKTPTPLSWQTYADGGATQNVSPNTWGIYIFGLMLDHQLVLGGVGEMQARAMARSAPVYEYINQHKDYYINGVDYEYRSRSNIMFRVRNDSVLEGKFIQEAEAAGLIGLEGSQDVDGCLASLNNAMPFEAVYKLIDFMESFRARNNDAAAL